MLDLKKFKKVSSNEKRTTLKHPDGHFINIAHSALNPKTLAKLHSLAMYSDGGDVKSKKIAEPNPEKAKQMQKGATSGATTADQAWSNIKNSLGLTQGGEVHQANPELEEAKKQLPAAKYADGGVAEAPAMQDMRIMTPESIEKLAYMKQAAEGRGRSFDEAAAQNKILTEQYGSEAAAPAGMAQPMANATMPQPVPTDPAIQQQADTLVPQAVPPTQIPMGPQGNPKPFGDMSAASMMQTGKEAIDAQEQAEVSKAKATTGVASNYINKAQQMQQHYERGIAEKNTEIQLAIKDFNDSHIDADRYQENKSTGSRIATAIGLILGGIGGGLTHQGNPALDFLNKQIDRDIEAQKSEINKKHTIIGAYFHQYGNMAVAENMARAVQTGIYNAQLLRAADSSGSVQAKANALKASVKLQQEMMPAIQRAQALEMANPKQTAVGGSGLNQANPALLVQHLVPKERQAEVFKEIKDAMNIRNGMEEGMAAFDLANKEQTLFSKNAIPGIDSAYIGKLKAAVLPQFQNIDGTVRQAAMDAFLPTILPAVGDTPHKIDVKRETLRDWYKAHSAAPTAEGYGIPLSKFASTTTNPSMTPQQEQWVQWARQNPNDPRSAALMKKLGVK